MVREDFSASSPSKSTVNEGSILTANSKSSAKKSYHSPPTKSPGKFDKENSPETSISPMSKVAAHTKVQVGATENPFLSFRKKSVPAAACAKELFNTRKSKSNVATFKETSIYVERKQ